MTTRRADWFPEEDLTRTIIGAFFYVHTRRGFGFLESSYREALARTLEKRGHKIGREVAVPIHFENEIIAYHRLDLLVDGRVIVELKSTERLPDHAYRQLQHYLRATRLQMGLLLHFGPKASYKRIVWSGRGSA